MKKKSETSVAVVMQALEKEAAPLKKKVSNLVISDRESFEQAGSLLKVLKEKAAMAKEQESKIVDPLKQSIKAAQEHFKPFYKAVEQIEVDTKLKMSAFLEKQKAAQRKLDSALENGEIKKISTYTKKLADVAIQSTESVSVRKIKKLAILNANLIPREFLVPDEGAIKMALLSGKKVPGCELQTIESLAI